jgi:hypothetical protein
MILLYTDFGSQDFYVGQMKSVLYQWVERTPVVDLFHQVPKFNIQVGAQLLAALVDHLPAFNVVLLAVVDPGVGGIRRPVVMQADGRWYVGPDNGLFSAVALRSGSVRIWEIVWRPAHLSNSFHGRDLFAPIAAMLARGERWEGALREVAGLSVEIGMTDRHQILYIDHYGNAITNIASGSLARDCRLEVAGEVLRYAHVFEAVQEGLLFWYENSIGLIEVACNQGNAATMLQLQPGMDVHVSASQSC